MKDGDAMTIRQMCDTFNVTARTLRFYETKDLLSPVRKGQKRLFTKRDRARLTLILRAKRFGFSLEESRQLLDLYDMGDMGKTQLARGCEQGQDRLAAMKRQHKELGEAIVDLQTHIDWASEKLAVFKLQAAE